MGGAEEDRSVDATRWVTVLFTELSESVGLVEKLGAQTLASAQEGVRLIFAEAVRRHGGQVLPSEGGTWQASFGVPQAGERDAQRAVEAALEAHHAVRGATHPAPSPGVSLSVRSGIHSGPARWDDDVAFPGRIQALGQVPAIARRLCELAAADEILVTEEALGPFVYAYSTHAMGRCEFPGTGLASHVRRVLGRAGQRSRLQAAGARGLARFTGRTSELQALREALAQVGRDGSAIVALSAPAGGGKTRLAEEFLREARGQGYQVLRGDCEEGLSSRPLQPFSDMLRRRWPIESAAAGEGVRSALRRLVVGVDADSAEHVPALLASLGLAVEVAAAHEVRADPQHARRALQALIEALARGASLVVFIDDWQWADDASREVAFQLLSRPGLRVLVLVATRPSVGGDVSLANVRTLTLAPLSEDETRHAIAELLPGGDPFVVQDVVTWSGGNPLYLEELCHFALRHHGLPKSVARSGPAWLESLVESRLNAVPASLRRVLDAAAVIGVVQPLAALTHLLACSPGDPLLLELAEHDFLFPADEGDEFRFKHGLTQRVVYAAIEPGARRRLHRQMAEWLCPAGDRQAEAQHCEALAYHWAGAGEPTLAAHCGKLAGDRAMSNSSVDRAKIQYRATLDVIEQWPDSRERYQAWRTVARRYGLACVFDPGASEIQVFLRAIELAHRHEDLPGAAYAEYWAAYALYALGSNRRALVHCRSCVALSTALDERHLMLQAHALLAQVHAASGQAAQAAHLFGQTVPAISRLRDSGAPVGPGLSYLLACQGHMLGDLGRFDEAEACFERAFEAAPNAGHEVNGSVSCLRASTRLWAGRLDDALADAEEAERVGTQVRSLYLYAMGRALAGRAVWRRDGGMVAARSMADATGWLQAHGQQLFISLNHGWLAEAAAAAGDTLTVRQQAGLALARSREGDLLGLPMALRALAWVEASVRGPRQASRHLALAERIARRRGSPYEQRANQALRQELESQFGFKPLQGPGSP